MELVSSFSRILLEFSPVLTAPTAHNFAVVLTGWVFARRRNVTASLLAAGVAGTTHHAAFHRLFSSAQWSIDTVFAVLLARLILPLLPSDSVIDLVLDDTLCRKRGKRMHGTGMHLDPLCSTRKTPVVNWGHNWVVLAIVCEFPFFPGRKFALPIGVRLYRNQKSAAKERVVHRSRGDLGQELLAQVCRAHPSSKFHLTADNAYCSATLVQHLPTNCSMTGKLRLNSALYKDPAPRRSGQRGRIAQLGERCDGAKSLLKNNRAKWIVQNQYGRRARVRAVTLDGRLKGCSSCPLRFVAVESLSGKQRKQLFFTTDRSLSAERILERYAQRWSIEQMFRDIKTDMGAGQPQGWTKQAVLRTTPTVMLLYALTVVWFAREGHANYRPLFRPWYPTKAGPSFADMLGTLRLTSARAESPTVAGSAAIPPKFMEALLHAYAQVA